MIVYYIYNQAFELFNAGYAAAVAYVVALFLIILVGAQLALQPPPGEARVSAGAETLAPLPDPPPERGWRLPFSPWHLMLAPVAIVFALPLIWMILSSFMSNAQINQFPPTIIPDSLHLDGWNTVLGDSEFPRWFLNSTIVALVTVVSNLSSARSPATPSPGSVPRLDDALPAHPRSP